MSQPTKINYNNHLPVTPTAMYKPAALLIAAIASLGAMATPSTTAAATADSDLELIKRRMVESYSVPVQSDPRVLERLRFIAANTDGTDVVIRELQDWVDDSIVGILLRDVNTEGLWGDIDYRSQIRSAWSPSFHLERMQIIARAYCCPSSGHYRSNRARSALHAALDGWLRLDPQCPNWWHNEIGGPRMLGPVLLMIESELTDTQKTAALKYMNNARIGMTGQNRTWLAGNVLMRGLLEGNDTLVVQARDAIMQEVSMAPAGKEGIQSDWSFHQHGPQQQFGNYGLAYISGISYWGRIFAGTDYAMSPDQIDIARNLVLRGMVRVMWRGMMDVNACGRQLFPYSQMGKGLAMGRVLLNMALLDTAYADLYKSIYNNNILKSEPNRLTGYSHFVDSDMSLHRTERWMASLKMSSPRVVGAEVVNGENLLSYQMADGALMLYRRGDEFENIAPVWDYTAIPGITTNITSDSTALFRHGDYAEFRGTHAFVGGLSVDHDRKSRFHDAPWNAQGISAMAFEKNGMTGYKSWFFGDGFVACAGSAIRSPRVEGKRGVRTSVAQCLSRGEMVVTMADGRRLTYNEADETVLIDSILLVEHDGVGYYFPGGARVEVRRGVRSGNWRRFATMYDTSEVRLNIFSISLPHGAAPSGATYRYVLLPDIGSTRLDLKKLLRHKFFDLSTDGARHSYNSPDGSRSMVFFEAGDAEIAGRGRLSLPTAAIVSIDADGIIKAVDPTNRNSPVSYRLEPKP